MAKPHLAPCAAAKPTWDRRHPAGSITPCEAHGPKLALIVTRADKSALRTEPMAGKMPALPGVARRYRWAAIESLEVRASWLQATPPIASRTESAGFFWAIREAMDPPHLGRHEPPQSSPGSAGILPALLPSHEAHGPKLALMSITWCPPWRDVLPFVGST
jgi:hypothetical protein